MTGDPWSVLDAELDRWAAAGTTATLWLRDDDAVGDTPALRRLLAICAARATPVALAVIPAGVEASLVATVAASPQATVVQHGFAHANHAPAAGRAAELGPQRSPEVVARELAAGRERLEQAFGDRFFPVLVPPWNRIDPGVVALVPSLGFVGVSTLDPREAAVGPPGCGWCNTHVDLVAWRRDRRFVGEAEALAGLAAHLADRRAGRVDPSEPTGVLTHHLVLDAAGWTFVERLLDRTTRHAAARWLDVRAAFAPGATSGRSA